MPSSDAALYAIFAPIQPSVPTNPSPADNATVVEPGQQLSWTGDGFFYDVYLGTDADPTTLVSADQTGTTYVPPTSLIPGAVYHWKVVAKSADKSLTATSAVWSFEPYYIKESAHVVRRRRRSSTIS